jgi:transposase
MSASLWSIRGAPRRFRDAEGLIAKTDKLDAGLIARQQVIEDDLDHRIEAQDRMARWRAILSPIPGVSARISTLLVVEMPELGTIDRKAAASLAGLAPHPSQSGRSHGTERHLRRPPCVRATFYMAALVAVRHHPKFKRTYLDLRAARKPAKGTLVAIARRMRDDISLNNAPFA